MSTTLTRLRSRGQLRSSWSASIAAMVLVAVVTVSWCCVCSASNATQGVLGTRRADGDRPSAQEHYCRHTVAPLEARIQQEQLVFLNQPPPREIPEQFLPRFTMDGSVPVAKYYVDDSNSGKGTHYQYSRDHIDAWILRQTSLLSLAKAKQAMSAKVMAGERLLRRDVMEYWVAEALKASIRAGDKVVVFGSTEPFYESLCLALGAGSVVTVEYNRLTFDHPNLVTTTPADFFADRGNFGRFDVALSITSFDHDGLGRYGDPVHPDADLLAMKKTKCVLKEGGRFVFTVPVGPDVVAWNLHRRYGPTRLPLMLADWKVADRIGWMEERQGAEASFAQVYEPAFVLLNTFPAAPSPPLQREHAEL